MENFEKIDPDQERAEEIRRLTEEEGWSFGGNEFRADQKYHIVLKKAGENGAALEKEIVLEKPYEKVFNEKGPIQLP